MTKRLIKGGVAWALADRLLGEWLGDRAEVGLCEAMGGLNRAAVLRCVKPASNAEFDDLDFIAECMNGGAGGDAMSRLLRARSFRKAGMKGSALTYDRQPVYRKEALPSEAVATLAICRRELRHSCARLELRQRIVAFGQERLGWPADMDDDLYETLEDLAGLCLSFAAECLPERIA